MSKRKEIQEQNRKLLLDIAQGFKAVDHNKTWEVGGYIMVRPHFSGFAQEAIKCRDGVSYCSVTAKYNSVWDGSVIQCDKCGQLYQFCQVGWIGISAFNNWCQKNDVLIIGFIAFLVVSVLMTLLGVAPWQMPI